MRSFAFNKIFIIESLSPSELQTGTELEKRINQWALNRGIDCQVVVFQVHSTQEWEIVWNGIYTSIKKMGNIPIIHLEMQGDDNVVGIDRGAKGTIPLYEVLMKMQHANVLSRNNIFFSFAMCKVLDVIRYLNVFKPMPFCGVLGSLETLLNDELLENYTLFYKSLLTSLDLDKAEQQMINAGVDASKFKLFKPEQIFMNAYLGYLETYKTDEQIREKAKDAAKSEGIVFQNSEEENRFVRDYRCSLLLNEDNEYQKAVDSFFIFNHYPDIRNRFVIPKNVYEFKRLSGEFGHDWLLNKRSLTVDDVKGVSLQILHAVNEFCSVNNIQYSLAYGTLLGAVRHKGFIPWDDDIDILMLRPDYDKFITTFYKEGSNLFSVASFETDSKFRLPFAKIVCNLTIKDELGDTRYGQSIDLFPIDKIPPQKDKAISLLRHQRRYWNLYMIKSLKWDVKRCFLKNVLVLILKTGALLIPYPFLNRLFSKNAKAYKDLDGDYYLGCLCAAYGVREIMPKSVFSDFISLPFEKDHFSCISDYDRYLTIIYGDYMKLPPKEKQITHHDFKAYWK